MRDSTAQITLPITGMTCAACVMHVEHALEEVDGVQRVSVNLAAEKAGVTLDGGSADLETLARAVEDAGYGIGLAEGDARHRRHDLRGLRVPRGTRSRGDGGGAVGVGQPGDGARLYQLRSRRDGHIGPAPRGAGRRILGDRRRGRPGG